MASEDCLDVLKLCLETNPKKRINMEELADHPWLYKNVYIINKKEEPAKLVTVKEEVPK